MANDIIYINLEEGMKRMMNKAKFYAKMLTKFKDDTNLNILEEALACGDMEKAQVAAHTIKGVAANLSLTELFNQSLDVETQIKGKSLKPESLESLKTCFAQTLNSIEEVIAKYV